ncbi:hypothetical protein DM01DRAFT_1267638, partial [Hesseltinella vesiculosa]
IVNTVEVYYRSPALDVHREIPQSARGVASASSLPPVTTKYPNTWVTTLHTREGNKLCIGTKTSNLLVTSNLRIDRKVQANVAALPTTF